jgi:hypothetical protein
MNDNIFIDTILEAQAILARHIAGEHASAEETTAKLLQLLDSTELLKALLDTTQAQLAPAANLDLSTVVDFERERRLVSEEAVSAIQSALQACWYRVHGQKRSGKGLRLRRPRHPRGK